ncbi:MAG: ABC transporter permease [Vicinamibacteria bacterium]|nr:ABC transporter permease [Vicinamibacteria bacterium]
MEMRGALRDRTIVVNSLLIPALLYPLLLWLGFVGMTFALGQSETFVARVAVIDWPDGHEALRREFEAIPRIQIEEATSARAAADRVIKGALDTSVEFLRAGENAGLLRGNFTARITYDKSKERSETARARVSEAMERYREQWLEHEAQARGLGASAWRVFTLDRRNVASKKQMGAFFMSLLVPLLFAAMVVVGCFYPAIDATAGERERGTWETLMASPAPRRAIVAAKYLGVTTFGLVAGLLNFTSMAATIKPILAPIIERAGGSMDVALKPQALPVVVMGALLLSGFAAAGMMVFASFAKTFKDGQSMITPFYLVTIIPMLLVQSPGIRLDARTAFIPIANVMLMVRSAILDSINWPAAALTVFTSMVFIAGLVCLAVFALRFEDVAVGAYPGTLMKLVKTRLLGRDPMKTRGNQG